MPKLTQDQKNEITAEFNNIFRDLEHPHRIVLERTWFRNILYIIGEHWFDIMKTTGMFVPRFGLAPGVPTPVANIIQDFVRSMQALVLNKQYTIKVWPNSQEKKDVDAAEIGNSVCNHLDIRNEYELEDIKELIALWMIATGNGFSRTFADAEGGHIYLINADGQTIKPGDVCTQCIPPFNIVVPSLGTLLKEKRYVGCKTLTQREWVEDTYKISLPAAQADLRQVEFQRQLLTLVASVSPWKGQGIEGDLLEMAKEDLVVFKEVEYRPTMRYPKGRYKAMADNTPVFATDSMPIPVGKNGEWFYTFDHFPYNRMLGGFWCRGGVDDLISPQNDINEIDQAQAINRKSLGRPIILTPADLTIKRLSEKGQALLAAQYDGRTAGGAKAQILPGTPLPMQVFKERELKKETIQEAGGDPKNVLRGKAPYAGAPGIAIDILRETAEQGHTPDINRFYRNWNRMKKKQLIIASEIYTESRLIKWEGRGNEILIRNFKGSDLRGNTDVRLELDSGLSSTNAGKNELIMQMLQYGLWDQQKGPKPDVRRELLRRLGMAGFPEEENLHRQRAELENSIIAEGKNEMFETIALPQMQDPDTGEMVGVDDPIFEIDDHFGHIQTHDKLIFSKEFRDFTTQQKMILIAHRQFHKELLAQQIMAEQQMMEQQGEAPLGEMQ